MKNKIIVVISILLVVLAGIWVFGYIQSHDIDVLEPKGMIAIKQRLLIITAFLLMLIVVIPVFILTLTFARRYRSTNQKAKYTPEWGEYPLAEYFWWGIPFIIIIFLAMITWSSSHQLNPFKPIVNGKKPLSIQVVALDWKWLFIYKDQGIATVNFVQFPKETPIDFEITSDAPMNSFWIPQLGGQIYAMPAMRSKLHLIANEEGTYRGSSANISGHGFAGMAFTAKATGEDEFDQWVESVKGSAKDLNFESYQQLAKPSEYHPVEFFVLSDEKLFDQIVMKYSEPKK